MTITRTEQTWTIDTASSPWVYSNGQKTTVSSTDQDFKITLVDDDGTATATFEGSGAQGSQGVLLADGGRLQFSSDKKMFGWRISQKREDRIDTSLFVRTVWHNLLLLYG